MNGDPFYGTTGDKPSLNTALHSKKVLHNPQMFNNSFEVQWSYRQLIFINACYLSPTHENLGAGRH